MEILNTEKLEPGDIILKRDSSRESVIIRKRSNSDYSHAILYVGISSCIESDGLGVQTFNLQRKLFEDKNSVSVYRTIHPLSNKELNRIIEFARLCIGTEYSTNEAKKANNSINEKPIEENRQFCTRFITQAYDYAGLKLVDNIHYPTPQNIVDSKILYKINEPTKTPNEYELEYANELNSPIDRQTDIINVVLEKIRNLTSKDIQTFQQIFQHVLDYPSDEREVLNILSKTEYFNMWEWDIDRNPHYYSYEKFMNIVDKNSQIQIANRFTSTEKDIRKRYEQSLEAMKHAYRFYNQEIFSKFINLYEILIELSNTRENIGKKYLEKST